jgi:hypothetical protein
MNWEAIGAIGETLGAIAVFITLIYLAIQVRQNTHQLHENAKALQRGEMNALMQNWSDLRRVEMSDSSLAGILALAESDFDALTDAERIRYFARWREIMWISHHLWQRVQAGIFEPDQWENGRAIVLSNLRAPGGLTHWQQCKQHFDPAFVREIEDAT